MNTNEELSFSTALTFIKEGRLLARKGWNGKNMYIFLITNWSDGDEVGNSYDGDGNLYEGKVVKPFIAMKCADGEIVPWLASQTDILARDWLLADS